MIKEVRMGKVKKAESVDAIAATTLFSFLGGQCGKKKKKEVDGWPLTGMEKVQWAHLSVGS